MTITTRLNRVNLVLLAVVAVLAVVVLAVEGYLGRVSITFAAFGLLVLVGAAIASARFLSTKRWVALFLVAGGAGLLTQVVGTGVGAWHYTNDRRSYVFVLFAFGLGSLFVYGLATILVNKVLPRRLHFPRAAACLPVLLGAAVLLGRSGHGLDVRFAAYYAALIAFAALWGGLSRTPTVVAIALASIVFGFVAETLGAQSGLWIFADASPPSWLILASWPLEGVLHFGLSAVIAGESPDPPLLLDREAQTFPLAARHLMSVTPTNARVVVRRGSEDKFALLDQVIRDTGFFSILDQRWKASGKSKGEFQIAVKPNFMFMYSKRDSSTFTDPALVEYLIDQMVGAGFTNLALVEAQSCYGNEFSNREVAAVARHVGYTEKNYRVVDLTLESTPHRFPPPLGHHPVGRTWRDADFRISFAKNKTHTWAAYTLTIKNIYGALAEQDKLHEYHNKREIYAPTIAMLLEFPVHFGFIDAFTSADGPFGIFADRQPNPTRTMIGGENLLAVDWVGASMMGMDPMRSRYMQLAVQAFGRPSPSIDGDASPYPGWRNVPDEMIDTVDAAEEFYGFTSMVFHLMNEMDDVFPRKPHSPLWRLARRLLTPLRARIFVDPIKRYAHLSATGPVSKRGRSHAQ